MVAHWEIDIIDRVPVPRACKHSTAGPTLPSVQSGSATGSSFEAENGERLLRVGPTGETCAGDPCLPLSPLSSRLASRAVLVAVRRRDRLLPTRRSRRRQCLFGGGASRFQWSGRWPTRARRQGLSGRCSWLRGDIGGHMSAIQSPSRMNLSRWDSPEPVLSKTDGHSGSKTRTEDPNRFTEQ